MLVGHRRSSETDTLIQKTATQTLAKSFYLMISGKRVTKFRIATTNIGMDYLGKLDMSLLITMHLQIHFLFVFSFFSYWVPHFVSFTPFFELYVLALTITVVHGGTTTLTALSLCLTLLVEAIGHLKLLNHNLKNLCRITRNANSNRRRIVNRQIYVSSDENIFSLTVSSSEEMDKACMTFPVLEPRCCDHYVGVKSITNHHGRTLIRDDIRILKRQRKEEFGIEKKLKICVVYHQAIIRYGVTYFFFFYSSIYKSDERKGTHSKNK